MATSNESNLCSVCNKLQSTRFCIGCEKYFCSKDFKEHEQQLSIQFENDVVRSHDELLEQIRKLKESNHSTGNLFLQIEEWKKKTIQKVEDAAEKAKHELSEVINKQRTEITNQLEGVTQEIRSYREEENYCETHIVRLRTKLGELQQGLEKDIGTDTMKSIIVENNEIDWNQMIYINEEQQNSLLLRNTPIGSSTTWNQNGITVAGGNGGGNELNQLYKPTCICITDDQTLYIADYRNNRIVEWKIDARAGRVVADRNRTGNNANQLQNFLHLIIDKERDSLIISDFGSKRVVRWPLCNDGQGETIISNITCCGLAMTTDGFLYVVDYDKHAVRRFRIGENEGKIVAGGNGAGNGLHQLHYPRYIFVNEEDSIYVSDMYNHRVMKWIKDAKEGIIVAGGRGQGNSLEQLSSPAGIFVDNAGTVYVADQANHRIMRWPKDATQGKVILGGNGAGSEPNQLYSPSCFVFDQEGNIYVADYNNHRVQMFRIDKT